MKSRALCHLFVDGIVAVAVAVLGLILLVLLVVLVPIWGPLVIGWLFFTGPVMDFFDGPEDWE